MSSVQQGNQTLADDERDVVPPIVEQLYEYTSSATTELVAGKIGMRGTAEYQVKWWATGHKATCVIIKAYGHGAGVDAAGYVNEEFAKSGSPLQVAVGGHFKYRAAVLTGQTLLRGDILVPQTATGYLVKIGTSGQMGPKVAVCLETITTAASPTRVMVLNLIGSTPEGSLQIVDETVVTTTNACTLSYTCIAPIAVHAYATTTSGAFPISTIATKTGTCLWTLSGSTITFTAADQVTQARIAYWAML
jgi:hypothetical protein